MQSSYPSSRVILIAERDQQVRKLQQFFLDEAEASLQLAEAGRRAREWHES